MVVRISVELLLEKISQRIRIIRNSFPPYREKTNIKLEGEWLKGDSSSLALVLDTLYHLEEGKTRENIIIER